MPSALDRYAAKRDFGRTPEPPAALAAPGAGRFVVQKHAATRLHYDFRLELDGVLLSWAVPKGPSLDPADKRMAVHVEDHPVAYADFEGTIPPGQYGAGTVIVWDRGRWQPVGDARAGLARGKLVFTLDGHKLRGRFELVRMAPKAGERQEAWLLIKGRDEHARPRAEFDVVAAQPDSVLAHTPLPESLAPQLATLTRTPPAGDDWHHELKFDGYRLLGRLDGADVRLLTRNGHDWTDRLKPLARDLAALGLRGCWLDGEIVVLDDAGVPDFNALQKAFDGRRTERIVWFVFDAPFVDGLDLRPRPWRERRARLEALLAGRTGERLRLSELLDAPVGELLASACRMRLEGLIAKRGDAPYVGRRSEAWLKLKCGQRQEFVIAGYADRAGSRTQVGSLLLAVHGEDGALRPAGHVGTGWDATTAAALHRRLAALRTDEAPFAAPAPGRWSARRREAGWHWVRPELVAEIAFAEWTPEGQVRQASFKGLRADQPPQAVTRERAAAAARRTPASARTALKVTHPERVVDAASGATKGDVVQWYAQVAERLLPHLAGRPVALLRAPGGVGAPMFFQKHDEDGSLPGVKTLDAALWPGHPPMIGIAGVPGLLGAAQMNTIEFHPGNAKVTQIDRPDRMVFDLDPGEGVPWPQVQDAAVLVRALLEELKLQAWLKTSGGKGLHVVVPIAPKLTHAIVKRVSQAVVQHLARTIPQRFVAKSGPANRVGRIFVDYLRNGRAATTVAPYSLRARPGLGVSMPVDWSLLPTLGSGAHFTIANARDHLSFETEDPWAGLRRSRQTLRAAMRALGVEDTER